MILSQYEQTPVLGATLPRGAQRTARKLTDFAIRQAGTGVITSYMDVGCGNGYMTQIVGSHAAEVVGIDVEPERLAEFRKHASPKTRIFEMSASSINFPDNYFSLITAFEVLEHVPDVHKAASEMARICSPGGLVVISVPQRWFPLENHGMRIGSRTYERKIPLLPYIRPLHRKWSLARIFSSSEMDALFPSLTPVATEYATPQFERAAAGGRGWESKLKFLRNILDNCESIPLFREFFGVSMLKAYRK